MPLISRCIEPGPGIEPGPDRVVLEWSMPAPPARVWWGLTDSEALPHWLGTLSSGRFAAGDVVIIRHAEDYSSTSKVLTCEPGSILSMTWEFPDEPLSHLRISLAADGDGTHLELAHDGLGAEAGGYLPGWHTHLLYLEGLLTNRPRDPASFWSTYAGLDADSAG